MFDQKKRMFAAVLVVFALAALVAAGAGIAQELAGTAPDSKPPAASGEVHIEVAAPESPASKAAEPAKPGPGVAPRAPGLFDDERDDLFARDPFETMQRMQEEMNRAFNDEFRVLRNPAKGLAAPRVATFGMSDIKVDMHEEAGNLKIACAMPGMDKSRIKVQIRDNVLNVSGERDLRSETKDKNYYRQEISVGSVSRSLPLPVPVDDRKAQARYENGVLTITVPKLAGKVETDHTIKVE